MVTLVSEGVDQPPLPLADDEASVAQTPSSVRLHPGMAATTNELVARVDDHLASLSTRSAG